MTIEAFRGFLDRPDVADCDIGDCLTLVDLANAVAEADEMEELLAHVWLIAAYRTADGRSFDPDVALSMIVSLIDARGSADE